MDQSKINHIFEIFYKNNPNPKTELEYVNNFTLLVAIILSAQSTDISVNKATKNLFRDVNSPENMENLGVDKLKEYIKTIGLFNTKANNIIKLCNILKNKYNNVIPETRIELETLPGVGRKTANVYLNCALGKDNIAVDTHVFRVANRVGLVQSNNVINTELDLEKCIPKKWKKHAHHWLILHGRYICKAKKPLCKTCPITNYCEYHNKDI